MIKTLFSLGKFHILSANVYTPNILYVKHFHLIKTKLLDLKKSTHLNPNDLQPSPSKQQQEKIICIKLLETTYQISAML